MLLCIAVVVIFFYFNFITGSGERHFLMPVAAAMAELQFTWQPEEGMHLASRPSLQGGGDVNAQNKLVDFWFCWFFPC